MKDNYRINRSPYPNVNYHALALVKYGSHNHRAVRFLPPAKVLESYWKDYEIMREQMIYGETDSFDVILRKLYLLQGKSRGKQLTNISLDTLIVMAGEALTTQAPFEPGALYTFETTFSVIEGERRKNNPGKARFKKGCGYTSF